MAAAGLGDGRCGFHIAFGKTVPDISLNAVANLGYAGMQFLAPVFIGNSLLLAGAGVINRRRRNE